MTSTQVRSYGTGYFAEVKISDHWFVPYAALTVLHVCICFTDLCRVGSG